MTHYQKPKIIKRPAYYSSFSTLENQYSFYLYNSESFFIRLYAYLPFIFSLNKLKLSKNNRFLDLGCADGPLLPTLHYNTKCSIAVDINKDHIRESQYLIKYKLNNSKNIYVLQSDGHNLPFRDNFFDFIFGFEVLEHVRHPNSVIDEIFRVLKNGGIFICTLPVELGPSLLIRTLLGKILQYKRPSYNLKQLLNSIFLKRLGERPKYIGYKENIGELGHINFDWRILFRDIKKSFKYVRKKYLPINFLKGFNPIVLIKAIKKIE